MKKICTHNHPQTQGHTQEHAHKLTNILQNIDSTSFKIYLNIFSIESPNFMTIGGVHTELLYDKR